MISTFALHPFASKQLIAQAVVNLPEVQKAFRQGKIFIGQGTTNMIIAELLLEEVVDNPGSCVAGVITQNSLCVTDPELRQDPWCIDKGKRIKTDWVEFVDTFEPGDIFIKGANAVDPFGRIGVLLADPRGGTIGKAIGILKARGIQMICPVGLEKMIPSCELAEKHMGIHHMGPHIGMRVGYMSVSNADVVTEIESIKLLFDLPAVQVAAGGVDGMEGAVILAAESDDETRLAELIRYVKKVNRKTPQKIGKKACAKCTTPCQYLEKD